MIQPPSRLPERLRIPGLSMGLVERLLALPRWVFFLGAMAAIPVAIVPIGGLARYTTSSPEFCLSCHATGETPNRGSRSLVHASFDQVTCVDCHAKDGQVVYEGYSRGFMAEPDRVAQNCQRCHANMSKTNEQNGFERNFMDIQITHKSHIERGATCTTCHSNVAHDLEVPQTNRPRMQACNTCHAVSDSCNKCHGNKVPTALPPVPVPSGSAGAIGDGRIYYLRVCSACHGARGDALAKVNLAKQDTLAKLGDQALFRAVSLGHGEMPAFAINQGGTLTDEQIRSITGYLASEAEGTGTPDGKALYDRNCVVCHGDTGDKVAGVKHSARQFWSNRTDSEIIRAVSSGMGAMPPMSKAEGGPLTSQEIRGVITYLEEKAGFVKGGRPSGPDGEALYQQSCAGCHGANGRQIASANLGSKEFVSATGATKLAVAVSDGKGGMPALGQARGGKLSNADVQAIVDYVNKLAGVATVGGQASAAAEGKTLYTSNCAGCHGANGKQIASGSIGTADFLKQKGDAALLKATAEGKGGMPALGKAKGGPLSDEQITAILAYLKSMAGGQ